MSNIDKQQSDLNDKYKLPKIVPQGQYCLSERVLQLALNWHQISCSAEIMSSEVNGTNGTSSPTAEEFTIINNISVPTWLTADCFETALQADVGEYQKILNFTVGPATRPGENYSSLIFRITIEVEINEGSKKTVSYILKVNHPNSSMSQLFNLLMLFPKEQEMYETIIPKFEKLFDEVGKPITIAPKCYQLSGQPPVDYILLEDICRKGFRNGNRLSGLDMTHMKHVLAKLAQFHAASACIQERDGNYSEKFTYSIYTEKHRGILTTLNKSDAFLANLKKWKNCEQYAEKLAESDNYLVDRIIQAGKFNPSEFNVLNQGDFWVNNIMFQYDAFGKVKETLFIDFQVGKYGSPAYDLYYVILTSAQMDIKLSQFDFMVKFYYDNLVENLKLLEYHRPLPKLKNLHMSLLKNGLSAYIIVSKILPVVMLDLSAFSDIHPGDDVKQTSIMYSNLKYVKAMEEIMPWLDNRGLLDFF